MVCDFYSCSIDFRLQSKRRFVASLAKLFKKAHDLPLVFNIYCLLLYDWLSFVLQHQEFTALTHCNGPISNNPFLGEMLFKIMKDKDFIFHTKLINKITQIKEKLQKVYSKDHTNLNGNISLKCSIIFIGKLSRHYNFLKLFFTT